MEAKQGQPSLLATATVFQSEPQFAALAMTEAVQKKASTHYSTIASSPPAIRIRIGKTEIEIPEGIESGHLEMVLKAVQDTQ